jgi:hypothetical protein
MEQILEELVMEVRELNKRIGANGFNNFLGTETTLISCIEELSIKMKRLNQTVSVNPITLEKHKIINKL